MKIRISTTGMLILATLGFPGRPAHGQEVRWRFSPGPRWQIQENDFRKKFYAQDVRINQADLRDLIQGRRTLNWVRYILSAPEITNGLNDGWIRWMQDDGTVLRKLEPDKVPDKVFSFPSGPQTLRYRFKDWISEDGQWAFRSRYFDGSVAGTYVQRESTLTCFDAEGRELWTKNGNEGSHLACLKAAHGLLLLGDCSDYSDHSPGATAIYLVDAGTGEELARAEGFQCAYELFISPNGKFAGFHTQVDDHDNGTLWLVDRQGNIQKDPPGRDSLRAVGISDEGALLLTDGGVNRVALWEPAAGRGESEYLFEGLTVTHNPFFTPDGKTVVVPMRRKDGSMIWAAYDLEWKMSWTLAGSGDLKNFEDWNGTLGNDLVLGIRPVESHYELLLKDPSRGFLSAELPADHPGGGQYPYGYIWPEGTLIRSYYGDTLFQLGPVEEF